MLKRIPKSDINIRPFKVYKNYTATNSDSGSGYERLYAENYAGQHSDLDPTKVTGIGNIDRRSLWYQIHRMYYDRIYNPLQTFSREIPDYVFVTSYGKKVLGGECVVFTIPQNYYGEEIKPKSMHLTDMDDETRVFIDDGYGNILSSKEIFDVLILNLQTGEFQIRDISGNIINLTIISFDAQSGLLWVMTDAGPDDILVFKLSTGFGDGSDEDNYVIGTVETEPNITQFKYAKNVVGNVNYEHGIIVITKSTNMQNELLNWHLHYKGTTTIYENEYYVTVGEDEFNVSTNPTAIYEVGGSVTSSLTYDFSSISTNPNYYTQSWHVDGEKYIKKKSVLSNGTELDYNFTSSFDGITKGGFGDYEISSSLDPTGSYLTPFITTIGLYDDNMDMIAVAKLGTPIKSLPDFPVNFIVRLDT